MGLRKDAKAAAAEEARQLGAQRRAEQDELDEWQEPGIRELVDDWARTVGVTVSDWEYHGYFNTTWAYFTATTPTGVWLECVANWGYDQYLFDYKRHFEVKPAGTEGISINWKENFDRVIAEQGRRGKRRRRK